MLSRRQFTRAVSAGLAGAVSPALPALAAALTTSARPSDVRFTVLRGRSKIGVRTVGFRDRPGGLAVHTVVDLAVQVVFITVFRYQHECEDVWASGQLVSLRSRTNEDGKWHAVEVTAEADGVRVVGPGGPLVVGAQLLTSNSLWDRRLVDRQRLIDAQHGGEIGLDIPTFGARATLVTTAAAPDHVVYEIAWAVLERFDDFLRLHAACAPLDPREMVRAANRAPLHPGAERYYRERGWLP